MPKESLTLQQLWEKGEPIPDLHPDPLPPIASLFDYVPELPQPQTQQIPWGQLLSEVRSSRGITQKQFAERMGIKQASVSAMERHTVFPRLKTRQFVTTAFQELNIDEASPDVQRLYSANRTRYSKRSREKRPRVGSVPVDRETFIQLRYNLGISQNELAKAAGVGHNTIWELEHGSRPNLQGANLERLAEALGVTSDALLLQQASELNTQRVKDVVASQAQLKPWGQLLYEVRSSRGITQEKLAEKMGATKHRVATLERRTIFPTRMTRQRLTAAFRELNIDEASPDVQQLYSARRTNLVRSSAEKTQYAGFIPVDREVLIELRKKLGISQHVLAIKANVAQTTIFELERGIRSRTRLANLERLAVVLGVTSDALRLQQAAQEEIKAHEAVRARMAHAREAIRKQHDKLPQQNVALEPTKPGVEVAIFPTAEQNEIATTSERRFPDDATLTGYETTQAVIRLQATLPPSDDIAPNLFPITFDQEHNRRGFAAVLTAGGVRFTGRKNIVLVPQRTLHILNELNIPFQDAKLPRATGRKQK